jgi:predicted enzyme related to lactoylglutathione lyase
MTYKEKIKEAQMDYTITHIEIPAPEMDKAIKFYSEVFGWKADLM